MSRPVLFRARVVRRCAGLTVALAALALPSAALAAVGEQADPVGDATPAISSSGQTGVQLLDITKVRVDVDPAAGTLAVAFSGDLNGIGHAGLQLRVGLSKPNSTGTCAGQGSPPDLEVRGLESARDYLGFSQSAKLYDAAGTLRATGVYENADQTGDGPRMTFSTPVLAGRYLRCVTGVWAGKGMSGFQNASVDEVDPFCLGGCPVVYAPTVRRVGIRLTWRRIGPLDSYVVATSTAPEGSPERTTTYKVVSGTWFTPPTVAGATRYYSVRANVDGSLWSRPEVAMSFPPA